MRYIVFFSVLSILCSSCNNKTRGPRPLTAMDSIRRVAAIARQKQLRELSQIHEDLTGPTDIGTGSGEVVKGKQYDSNILNDSLSAVTRSFEKKDVKYKRALQDSSTEYGPLLNRFKVLDSQHKYLSATYTSAGHLLTFHSEVTMDDRHELDYDLHFDEGRLIYITERRSVVVDPEDQSQQLSYQYYYMSGASLLYCYMDEGLSQPHRGHVEPVRMTRYALSGDIKGHVARTFNLFLKDYDVLTGQTLEAIVYTPSAPVPGPAATPVDKGSDNAPPSRIH